MKTNLKKYKSKSGFKVPHNYMSDLEASLFEKLDINAAHRELVTSGFQVPKNYFNTLEPSIQAKLNKENNRGKLLSLFSKKQLYYASAIAAIFIVAFSTVLLESPETNDLNNLNYAALEEYIDEEDLDLNYNDISNLIYEEGLILENLNSYSYSEQAVFEYLSENVEDSGLIIE